MKLLKELHNYFFCCGIGKDPYREMKKDAYISNFVVWRILHGLMAVVFALLFLSSLFNDLLRPNLIFYLVLFLYSLFAIASFSILKKDSLAAQIIIYLSISVLFIFACLITQNKPELPATTFIVFLLVAPMFMIDRPVFMALELICASAVFLVWMYFVKPYEIWEMDMINVIPFTLLGIVLNIIANTIRIREFVLTRQIEIQKDTDDLTGLKNKGALTREISAYLADPATKKAMLFILDVDHFKSINDTYGHDVGDLVISGLGHLIGEKFQADEITGRFGGDEFIIFVKNVADPEKTRIIAAEIITGAFDSIKIPDTGEGVNVSVGAALYTGGEITYPELFKKADIALYQAKRDNMKKFCLYQEAEN